MELEIDRSIYDSLKQNPVTVLLIRTNPDELKRRTAAHPQHHQAISKRICSFYRFKRRVTRRQEFIRILTENFVGSTYDSK
jgi:hypothetical protein